MSDVSVAKDKKGSAFVVSHKRVGITECIYFTYDELKELKTILKGVVP